METKPRHLAGFFGRTGGEYLLHIIVGRRTSQAGKYALEQHHGEENAKQAKPIFGDLIIRSRYDITPVQIELRSRRKDYANHRAR